MALSTEEITKVDRFIRTFDLGLIYIIASDAGGPVKIGKSSLLSGRLDSLQIGNPSELFVYAAFVFDRGKAHAVEQLLHRALGASWLRGEWYSLSASEAKSACRRIIRYGANGTSPGQNRKKATKPTRRKALLAAYRKQIEAMSRQMSPELSRLCPPDERGS